MTELIAHLLEEYEDIIIELSRNHAKLEEIKNRLQKNKYNSNLFNSQKFTDNLERIYSNLFEELK